MMVYLNIENFILYELFEVFVIIFDILEIEGLLDCNDS